MEKYDENSFNEAMARLKGYKDDEIGILNGKVVIDTSGGVIDYCFDPYNDLNRLIPLAFKYDVMREPYLSENGIDYEIIDINDWINEIKNDLWKIAQEKQNENIRS